MTDPVKTEATAEEETKTVPPVDGQETSEETTEETSEETTEETTEETSEEEGGDEPKGVPAEMVKFFVEVEETGELSEESYAELEEAGYSREVVDTYMRGLSTITTEEDAAAVIESVGGEEAFQALQQWANETLSEDDRARYNRAVKSSDTAEMAVAWLKAKQAEAAAEKPKDAPARKITGKTSKATEPAVKPFADRAEATKAVRDPRYGKSTEEGIKYTNEVLARLQATSI